MKGVCAIHNGKALALVTRSGSHADKLAWESQQQ